MKKIIFKPSINSLQAAIFLGLVIFITVVLGGVMYQSYTLYQETAFDMALQTFIFLLAIIIASWISGLAVILWPVFKYSMVIDNEFLYSHRNGIFGFGENKMINLKEINLIDYRKIIVPIFTGKTVIPMTKIWWVFNFKDGHREEVYINGWDKRTLKKIISYLKDKFPNIKFDTHVYRDSSEVLSGVDEILKNNPQVS